MRFPAPPRVVGRRGAALLFFSLLDFVYAFSLCRPAPAVQGSTSKFLADVAPLHVFAWLWLMVGVVCLVGAFGRHRWPALDTLAFLAAIMIKVFWAALLIIGWLVGDVQRGWVAGAVWLALGVLVVTLAGWPEPVEE